MSYMTGPCCLYSYFLQKNGGKGCHTGQDLVFFTLISYKSIEEKGVILDRTLFSLLLFPTKASRRRVSYWTGPCFLDTYFLQKNGGEGCHCGQDLVDVSVM